jgi:hypothetical protein
MTDINERLCRKLGICGHHDGVIITGSDSTCEVCGARVDCDNPEVDFTTDDGAVALLRIMMERDDWWRFVKKIGLVTIDPDATRERRITYIRQDYIATPGALAQAVDEWLKERKEEKP